MDWVTWKLKRKYTVHSGIKARRSARGNGNSGKNRHRVPKPTPAPNHPTLLVSGLNGKRRWVRDGV